MATRPSLGPVCELWLRSWETALAALDTAIRSRTLSASEAGGHKAVIATERQFVTEQFAVLMR